MKVNISGQHMDLGQALQQDVENKCEYLRSKYLPDVVKIDVHFIKRNKIFEAEILLHDRMLTATGDAQSYDVYDAFAIAMVKIEKQLRRYKSKINKKHKKTLADVEPKTSKIISGTKYVIEPSYQEIEDDNPVVIAEKTTSIDELTVSEAVMKMDLMNLPALAFINKANNRYNFIYYRKDGNISWVDPIDE